MVGLLDQAAKSGRRKGLLVVRFPGGRNRCGAALHRILEVSVFDNFNEVRVPDSFEVAPDNANIAETESQIDVLSKLHQVNNSQEDRVQGILNNVLAHEAALGDRNGIAVDHSEAFLENGVLALRWRDLLFS